jgi:cobalt-zinc-cadmium efflux system protein
VSHNHEEGDHTPAQEDSHAGHAHGHAHSHAHAHGPMDYGRAFAIGVGLNLTYVIVQAGYGLLANSVALLADAAHNLSDVLGLVLAWGAAALAKRLPSARFTYGLRGSSILAALANAAFLLLVTGGIAWEAIQRLLHPSPVAGVTVIWVAALGIAINGGSALLFMSGRKHDLNVRGAFLHLLSDAVVSFGVVLAGIGIIYTGWLWLDPAISLIISVVIVAGTWGLLRDSVRLALDAVPEGVNIHHVRACLAELPGVVEVHDLHVWGMSTTDTALTAHLVMPEGHPGDAFVAEVCQRLQDEFRISHATVQVEITLGHPCVLAPDHVV